MELAAAGVDVDLYDRNAQLLTQASARNEGKIHLGYVYAHDRSLQTARQMMRGAASFAPLMRRWVGAAIDGIPVSSAFHYAVHRDSLLTPDEVEHHFRACAEIARDEHGDCVDYFGADYREPPVRLNGDNGAYDHANISASFRTAEVGIDPEAMAALVRKRLAADPKIRPVLKVGVTGVEPDDRGCAVIFSSDGRTHRERYDHVVNALWDGRLAVDASAGIKPPRSWLFRIKHYARVHAPALTGTIPSTTIVLGPFGDIVDYRNGHFYLSWYPAGMAGRSSAVTPPDWPREIDQARTTEMYAAIRAGLAAVAPAVRDFQPDAGIDIAGGIIFAWGASDIDDPASGLHERASIGPEHFGRYHSINTGKLTMAPLFGKMTADRILA